MQAASDIDWVEAARGAVRAAIDAGVFPTYASVLRQLYQCGKAISQRTLQRRLRAADTYFDDIVVETRLELVAAARSAGMRAHAAAQAGGYSNAKQARRSRQRYRARRARRSCG